ncbi:MAG: hypothetical protein K2G88_11120, partial [Oscillospiraceae bacterium]|nr:hypothetical protein [Oscillospiraceae bacterium]
TEILFMTDTFKFSTIQENGWLKTAKKYIGLLNKISILCIIASIIIFILLLLCCMKQITEFLYWTGIASFISGLLLLLPCMYLKATDYVSGFVIKDQQIFSAVVGYLHILTNQAILLSAITLLIGLLFLVIFGFLQKNKTSSI